MNREARAVRREAGAQKEDATLREIETWTIRTDDPDFPPRLKAQPRSSFWQTMYGVGDCRVLRQTCLGLICSVQCTGSVVIKTFDAIRELRDAGIIVAGGFHSPMEQECLDFLLRGAQPVVICPAKRLSVRSLPDAWQAGINAGRILILTPFGDEVERTTETTATIRNEFVVALSSAVLIPHASPGGKAESTAKLALDSGKPVFTFPCEENARLIELGAREYDVVQVAHEVQ